MCLNKNAHDGTRKTSPGIAFLAPKKRPLPYIVSWSEPRRYGSFIDWSATSLANHFLKDISKYNRQSLQRIMCFFSKGDKKWPRLPRLDPPLAGRKRKQKEVLQVFFLQTTNRFFLYRTDKRRTNKWASEIGPKKKRGLGPRLTVAQFRIGPPKRGFRSMAKSKSTPRL